MNIEQQINNPIPLNNIEDSQILIPCKLIYYSSNILITPDFKIIVEGRNMEPMAHHIECPGGKIEYGETPLQAAKRETEEEAFEEAGLQLEESRIKYINTYEYGPSPFGKSQIISKRTVYTFYTIINKEETEALKRKTRS